MGRGVRTADDRCAVWIPDPRFSLPRGVVGDFQRRLTQGPAAGWQGMALAVSARFRASGARSTYDWPSIVPLAAMTEAAA